MIDQDHAAQLGEAARIPTSAAKLAAERAGKNLDAAKVAMMEGNTSATFDFAERATNAARAAMFAQQSAESAIYHSALAQGATPSRAHALTLTLSADAREAAQEAAAYAAILRKAHRNACIIAQRQSAATN